MKYFEMEGLRGSVLGFGCGSVMGRIGRRTSMRAMGTAWDAGINLYDVAPSYGYGEAEALLGAFLRGRRAEAVIVTKFGIMPERRSRWKSAVKPIVRRALRLVPNARPVVRKLAGGDRTAEHFTVPLMRTSLENSLRHLGTDHVDVLLLHGPPTAVVDHDDLMAALADVVAEGKVRAAGLSGGSGAVRRAAQGPDVLRALQAAVNFDDLEALDIAAHTDRLFMAHHPFGGPSGVERSLADLRTIGAHEATGAALRDKLADVDNEVLADAVLSTLLRDTVVSAVIPSMFSPSDLHANVRAIEHSRFTDDEIRWLRARLQTSAAPAAADSLR